MLALWSDDPAGLPVRCPMPPPTSSVPSLTAGAAASATPTGTAAELRARLRVDTCRTIFHGSIP
jgi:hypothetical protein